MNRSRSQNPRSKHRLFQQRQPISVPARPHPDSDEFLCRPDQPSIKVHGQEGFGVPVARSTVGPRRAAPTPCCYVSRWPAGQTPKSDIIPLFHQPQSAPPSRARISSERCRWGVPERAARVVVSGRCCRRLGTDFFPASGMWKATTMSPLPKWFAHFFRI